MHSDNISKWIHKSIRRPCYVLLALIIAFGVYWKFLHGFEIMVHKNTSETANSYNLQGKDPCQVWNDFKQRVTPTIWWQQFCDLESDWLTKEYNCVDMRMMGNRAVCFDANLIAKDACLVYSFGIDNDFQFDDAMANFGCTVYSFDPSMNTTDHKHADRVFFKTTGLSGQDNDSFVPRLDIYVHKPTTWRVRRLTSIMEELGHKLGSLSILKMDIEANEFEVLSDLLRSDILPTIPQVLVEWHLFKDTPHYSHYADIFDDYYRFKALGFRKYWNPAFTWPHTTDEMTSQAEISYLNINFLPRSSSAWCTRHDLYDIWVIYTVSLYFMFHYWLKAL